jgi:protein TonB
VFGITMESTVSPGSNAGFQVRVGNTLMKEPEVELTPPSEVKPYGSGIVALHQLTQMPKAPARGCPQAPYPAAAKRAEIEGAVRLQVDIDAAGAVSQVLLLRGLGYGLDEAAMAALRQCRWRPGKVGDDAVATRIVYTYRFVLED